MNIERKFLKFIREKVGSNNFTDLDFASAMRVPIKQAKDFLMTLDGTYLSISYTDNSATANYKMNSQIKYDEMYKNTFDYLMDHIGKIFGGIAIACLLVLAGWGLYMDSTVWRPEKEAKDLIVAQQQQLLQNKRNEEYEAKKKEEEIQEDLAEKKAKQDAQDKITKLNFAVTEGRKEIISKTNKCLDPEFSQLMLGYYDSYVIVRKDEDGKIKYRYPITLNEKQSASLPTSEPTSNPSN